MTGFTPTKYYCFPDRTTALALFQQVGGNMDDHGNFIPGDENYTVVELVSGEGDRRPGTNGPSDAGVVWAGSWWMGKISMGYPQWQQALAAFAQFDATDRVLGTAGAPRSPWNSFL